MVKLLNKLKCKFGYHDIVRLTSKGVMGSDIVKKVLDDRQSDLKLIEYYSDKTIKELMETIPILFEYHDILFCPEVCIRDGCGYISSQNIDNAFASINISIDMYMEELKKISMASGKYENIKNS